MTGREAWCSGKGIEEQCQVRTSLNASLLGLEQVLHPELSGVINYKNKKNNDEQSDLCNFEQVTLKLQLPADYCLTTWLQIWHRSLLGRDSSNIKGADLEKQNGLFGDYSI